MPTCVPQGLIGFTVSGAALYNALDGFGIFGQFGEGGKRLANGDLDACHGHTHAIPWDGQTLTLYHYHMTREYPYSVGCFHGTRS